eukprot:1417166-Prymnesium_polylepis.1
MSSTPSRKVITRHTMSRPYRGRVASMSRHIAVVSRRCRGGVATGRGRTCRAHVAHMSRRVAPRRAAS